MMMMMMMMMMMIMIIIIIIIITISHIHSHSVKYRLKNNSLNNQADITSEERPTGVFVCVLWYRNVSSERAGGLTGSVVAQEENC